MTGTLQIRDRSPDHWARRAVERYTWRFPGGESYEDAEQRAARALPRVADGPGRVALVVSHEMIGRMLVGRALALPSNEALRLSLAHGAVYRLAPGRPLTELELTDSGQTE